MSVLAVGYPQVPVHVGLEEQIITNLVVPGRLHANTRATITVAPRGLQDMYGQKKKPRGTIPRSEPTGPIMEPRPGSPTSLFNINESGSIAWANSVVGAGTRNGEREEPHGT